MLLVIEHLQRQTGVQIRIVTLGAFERRVLVVLDEMVVRVGRERQRIQPQRVHHRHPQQPQPGSGSLQMGKVELDDVVSDHKVGAIGEAVERRERLIDRAPVLDRRNLISLQAGDASACLAITTGLQCPCHASARVGTHTRQRVDVAVPAGDFKVNRQAA